MDESVYVKIGKEIGELVESKQKAYGDSFSKSGKILEVLYPNGVSVDQYDDLLTIARIIDKLFRIATAKDSFGESPYRDIVGYSILGVRKDEIGKQGVVYPTNRQLRMKFKSSWERIIRHCKNIFGRNKQ